MITFKQRLLCESKYFEFKSLKNNLFSYMPVKVNDRFKDLDSLNKFCSELNAKSHRSELQFETKLRSHKKLQKIDLIFWKNYPVLNTFFIDFYSEKLRLAIEIDGHSHRTEERNRKDKNRDDLLQKIGIATVRVSYPEWFNFEELVSLILLKTGNISKKDYKPVRKRYGRKLKTQSLEDYLSNNGKITKLPTMRAGK